MFENCIALLLGVEGIQIISKKGAAHGMYVAILVLARLTSGT
ncbi:hypothetical protein DAI22_03g363650 [Oryza sativa Japonica Group]|nr:hypothetical protein DAI22_03g363650 [Oryza sativa Japonica Group]